VLALNNKLSPTQSGPLFPATGVDGIAFTVTDVVPASPVHPFSVAVTEYKPEFAVVALIRTGFCEVEVKLPGPDQLYVAPPTVLAVKLISLPEQIGELLPAVGAAGVGKTDTVTVPSGLTGQPGTFAETEYVPEANVVILPIIGF